MTKIKLPVTKVWPQIGRKLSNGFAPKAKDIFSIVFLMVIVLIPSFYIFAYLTQPIASVDYGSLMSSIGISFFVAGVAVVFDIVFGIPVALYIARHRNTKFGQALDNIVNIPLIIPEEWPDAEFDADKSLRGALIAYDLNLGLEYNIKMFQRWWGEALDPNEQKFFIELCDDLDIDPNEFSGRLNSTDTKERIKGTYKRARKLGIFETPTILIGEERFVGIDRISNARAKLTELGLAK